MYKKITGIYGEIIGTYRTIMGTYRKLMRIYKKKHCKAMNTRRSMNKKITTNIKSNRNTCEINVPGPTANALGMTFTCITPQGSGGSDVTPLRQSKQENTALAACWKQIQEPVDIKNYVKT